MFDIDAALMRLIELEGSDLHLKVPARPIIRRHGKLETLEGSEQLRAEDTERILRVRCWRIDPPNAPACVACER